MTRLVRALISLVYAWILVTSLCATGAQAGWRRTPVVPRLDAATKKRLLGTVARGRRLGNRPDVFIKVGDSLSQSPAFLQGLGCGRWTPGHHGDLRATISSFAGRSLEGTSSDCARVNSFSRNSAATLVSKPSAWAVTPGASSDPACHRTETPLACEIRMTAPAYAVILFGTNDVSLGLAFGTDPLAAFLSNTRQIIEATRRLGVAPILGTIPPRTDTAEAERVTEELNAGLYGLASERHVPVVNLWRAFEPLPDRGLTTDGLHPSISGGPACGAICDPNTCAPKCQAADFTPAGLRYGHDMRNLATLLTLRRLSRAAQEQRRP
jgi:hypothetical protein